MVHSAGKACHFMNIKFDVSTCELVASQPNISLKLMGIYAVGLVSRIRICSVSTK